MRSAATMTSGVDGRVEQAPPADATAHAHRAERPHGRPFTGLAFAVVAIVLLPLLQPAGPGNSAPVDVAIAVAIVVVALATACAHARHHLPYAVPVGVLVLAGSIAGLLRATTATTLLALFQDLFLLAWAATVVNVARDTRALRVVFGAWAIASICWAGVLMVALLVGNDGLAGITARNGGRAALTFSDPNLAASYFVVSFAIVAASRVPRPPVLRALAYALLVAAIVAAGSNGGLIGLAIVVLVIGFASLARRLGTVAAIAVACLLAIPSAFVVGTAFGSLTRQAQDPGSSLHDSLGRLSSSVISRGTIFGEDLRLAAQGDLIGIGPASTKAVLERDQAAYVKEAHNDYLATFVERGLMGAIGLILLIGAVALRARVALHRTGEPAVLSAVPNPAALVAALVAVLVSAGFYEVLHFRHVWALLGVVAAVGLVRAR
jgi:O-antigen ligase